MKDRQGGEAIKTFWTKERRMGSVLSRGINRERQARTVFRETLWFQAQKTQQGVTDRRESGQTGVGVSVKGDDIQIYVFVLPMTKHEKQGCGGAKALACGTLRQDEHVSGQLSSGLAFSTLTTTVMGKVTVIKDANV